MNSIIRRKKKVKMKIRTIKSMKMMITMTVHISCKETRTIIAGIMRLKRTKMGLSLDWRTQHISITPPIETSQGRLLNAHSDIRTFPRRSRNLRSLDFGNSRLLGFQNSSHH